MYVLFLISAVGLGLMTVILESAIAKHFLGHKVHAEALAGLGKAGAVVLLGYAALRVGDLAMRGVLTETFGRSWHSTLFVAELTVSALLPGTLLLLRRVRTSLAGLTFCAGLTVAGMVWYRLDVSIVAFARREGLSYFPSWMEFAVSLGIVAGAALIFIFFVERFRVYDEGRVELPAEPPSFDPATPHNLLPRKVAAVQRFSLVAVGAAALTVLLLPDAATLGAQPGRTPAAAARTVEGRALPRQERKRHLVLRSETRLPADGPTVPLLLIDGNRNGDAVLLDHRNHIERLGGDSSCGGCHHLDVPYDLQTACVTCHRDMYEPTDVFVHATHVQALGGNEGCVKCHPPSEGPKVRATATACRECHENLLARGSLLALPHDRWSPAAGYVDAMHGLCQDCHRRRRLAEPERWSKTLDRCDTCHDPDRAGDLRQMKPDVRRRSVARDPRVTAPERTATLAGGAGGTR